MNEQNIAETLTKKFSMAEGMVRVPRDRRIFVDDATVSFVDILEYARKELGFAILLTMTGLDEGANFAIMYHLARQDGIVLNLRRVISKDSPKVKSIIDIFPSSEIYEREIADLFGIKVEGLPEGRRYPLPDNWPKDSYPLRKDWKAGPDVPTKEGQNA